MTTRKFRISIALIAGMFALLVPATALADGGPYSGVYQVSYSDGSGTTEQFELGVGSGCPGGWQDVVHRWKFAGGSWSSWSSMGGCVDGYDVASNQNGKLELFGVGSDYAVWHKWQTQPWSGPWSDWFSLHGTLKGNAPWTGSMFNGQPYLHVYGLDVPFGNRWVNYQTTPGCCWSGWNRG